MTQPAAEDHLKRAYGFIQEVEHATESFRQRAIAHSAQIDGDQPFLQGMVSTIKGNRQLKQQKAALVNDLQLASQEVAQASSLDPNASITNKDGNFGSEQIRALICYMNGQIEMIYGQSEMAKRYFNDSLQIIEFPEAHYMLGLVYESDYSPAQALTHFERCLELEPSGEFSVSALREANEMRNYRKKFRGSWLLLFLLIFVPFPPFLLAVVYFFVKRK